MYLENYRKTIHRRITLYGIFCCLMTIPHFVLQSFADEHPFNGFLLGAACGIDLLVVFFIGRCLSALKDESALKKLYIYEHDERRQWIRLKAGSQSMPIILAGLLIAMMIAGYFSKVVFFTLLGVTVFIGMVMLVCKGYYRHHL